MQMKVMLFSGMFHSLSSHTCSHSLLLLLPSRILNLLLDPPTHHLSSLSLFFHKMKIERGRDGERKKSREGREENEEIERRGMKNAII